MKRYFNYELKKNSYVLGALTLVMVILYVVPILISNPPYSYNSFNIELLSIYVGIVAVIVPMWLMDYKMKKRSVDLYYALPLSHTKILTVRFLLGLLAVFVPYTLAYWLGALTMIAKTNATINAVWFVPFYFATLIPIYIVYSITAFVYTRANNGIDGFMFLLFWFFALTLVTFTVEQLVNVDQIVNYMYLLPVDPLIKVTSYFKNRIFNASAIIYSISGARDSMNVYMIVGFVISTLMSAGATFGLLWSEKKSKAENVSQISESWFGYKVMIPLYTVCLTTICPLDNNQSLLGTLIIIIIATAVFFISVLYKRTIKIGKKQAIILGASFLAGIMLPIINNYV